MVKISQSRKDTVQYINLQLASLGQPLFKDNESDTDKFCNPKLQQLTSSFTKGFREKSRLLSQYLSPADSRIQYFLNDYLKDVDFDKEYLIPNNTLVLNQAKMVLDATYGMDFEKARQGISEIK